MRRAAPFAAAIAALAALGPARAAELPEAVPEAQVERAWDVAVGAKLVSDYVDRGYTNSDGRPAAQGYVEASLGDWAYAGLWASGVRFPLSKDLTDPSAEIDLYGGLRHAWGAFSLDAGALWYLYPGERTPYPGARETDYYELALKPAYVIGEALNLGGQLFWSGDYANTGSNAVYLAASAKLDLPPVAAFDITPYVSAEIGRQWLGRTRDGFDPADYVTWNAGVGAVAGAVTVELRYSGSDLGRVGCLGVSGSRGWCGHRVMASVALDTSLGAGK